MDEEKKYDPYTGYEITEEESVENQEETNAAKENETQDKGEAAVQTSSMPLLALIFGIISIVFICCCPPISLVIGIVALVLGLSAPKMEEKRDGKAIAGMICGIIGMVLTVLVIFIAIYTVSTDKYFQKEFKQEFNQRYQEKLDESTSTESDDF